jgi:alpha-ketoglutarate-dependent taurine dioxygenase
MALSMAPNELSIEVSPLSIHIGAEIGGVDLTQPLPPQQLRDIREALVQWKVVFFRDQFLDHDQHLAFARQFGDLTPGHAVYGGVEGYPEIFAVAKHRKGKRFSGELLTRAWTGWHTDITCAINPPAGSILRGDVVPPYGGDTQFTNLATAYNGLSETMRGFLDGLRGIHRITAPPGTEASKYMEDTIRENGMVSEHPLIRVHPESGERVLFASPSFLKSIVGMSPRESQILMEFLWEHIVRAEYTVRFAWEPGSIAFWDNRAVAHLAPLDIFDSDFDRQFYRVTLAGDVPVGVDGRPSTPIGGDPIPTV